MAMIARSEYSFKERRGAQVFYSLINNYMLDNPAVVRQGESEFTQLNNWLAENKNWKLMFLRRLDNNVVLELRFENDMDAVAYKMRFSE